METATLPSAESIVVSERSAFLNVQLHNIFHDYLKWNLGRGTKRNVKEMNSDIDDDLFNELDKELHTPKRRKMMSTSKYIYKTLFEDGQNSDVTIVALNSEWRLHKVYLCQSPYFSSMFSGSWKEANDDEINIEIADPNVTADALKIVLGSLYQDEVTIEPARVVPVLGAAILFQLDSLINQCCDIMKESINIQTVIHYYDTASQYGLKAIRSNCFDWLLRNLLSYIPEHPKKLRDICPNLMTKLVKSSQLYVIQTEFSIYLLLKMRDKDRESSVFKSENYSSLQWGQWVFLNENTEWEGKASDCILEAHKFFQTPGGKVVFVFSNRNTPVFGYRKSFLSLDEGKSYQSAFDALRLPHLINHHMDVEMLEMDRILPQEWLLPIFKCQWYHMLRVDQGVDKGPKHLSENEFDETCLRCGRILPSDTQHMWRWTGYNFGLDLIVSYDKRVLRFKRNQRNLQEYRNSVSPQSKRHILYRVTLASVNEQKQLLQSVTTGLQTITLNRNEEVRVITLDKEVTFPLILNANFAFLSPFSTLDDEALSN